MHLFDSTGVAIVSAFMGGVAALIFGNVFFYLIKEQVVRFRNANRRHMAVRNK